MIKEELKKLRTDTGMDMKEFSLLLKIPYRTYQNWELGKRTPPEYIVFLIKEKLVLEKKMKEEKEEKKEKEECIMLLQKRKKKNLSLI